MDSTDRLDGCVAVVSGASGRLGPVIVRTLSDQGALVVAVARDLDRLRATLAAEAENGRVDCRAADLREGSWAETVAAVSEEYGRLDVLVNNAHVARGGSLRTTRSEDWSEAFELAVTATADAINAAREPLAASAAQGGPGAVINVASMYGVVAPVPGMYDSEEGRNPPAYGAAKAAMLQLTRYAAAELGPRGVRVNAVTLGPFPGEPATPEAARLHSRIAERTMLGRIGRPEEVASAIRFLASPASGFVTGSQVAVDGGWTAW